MTLLAQCCSLFSHSNEKVCRTKDIFLTSSFAKNSSDGNNGPRQRPKLNLTVKKELQGMGGQIMAQSKMAKVRKACLCLV
jgi:hypothetical protein